MSKVLLLPYIGAVPLRTMWIGLGLWYLGAGSALAMSRHSYPTRIWSVFYMVGAAVLLFFNIGHYEVAQTIVTLSEVVLWIVLLLGGTTVFIILLIVGDDLDDAQFPKFYQFPKFLVYWAIGRDVSLEVEIESDVDGDGGDNGAE